MFWVDRAVLYLDCGSVELPCIPKKVNFTVCKFKMTKYTSEKRGEAGGANNQLCGGQYT